MRGIVILTFILVLHQVCSQTSPLIGFSAATFSEEERGCAADIKLDLETVQKAFDEHMKLVEGDERINKYLGCVFKKYNFITDKGEIDNVLLAVVAKQLLLRSHGVDDVNQVESNILKECQGAAHAVKVHNCRMHQALKYGYGENVGKYNPDEECLTELKLDHKVAAAVKEEAYKNLSEGDDPLNQYLNCLWKHYNRILSALGLHNFESVSTKIAQTCHVIQGSDLSDSTVKVYNCLVESALKSK